MRERFTAGRPTARSARIFLDGVLDFAVLDRDFFEIPPEEIGGQMPPTGRARAPVALGQAGRSGPVIRSPPPGPTSGPTNESA